MDRKIKIDNPPLIREDGAQIYINLSKNKNFADLKLNELKDELDNK